jgi:hypothetical protein
MLVLPEFALSLPQGARAVDATADAARSGPTSLHLVLPRPRPQRDAVGDPRLSLQECYPTHTAYVAKVTAAANQLVQQRLLLHQDANTIISQANAAAVP